MKRVLFGRNCDVDLTLLDRYLISAVSLIPRFYVIAIQYAVFALQIVIYNKKVMCDQIPDFGNISGKLLDLIHTMDSIKAAEFANCIVGYEEKLAEMLLSQGVEFLTEADK